MGRTESIVLQKKNAGRDTKENTGEAGSFAQDIRTGLSTYPKRLPSKYLYDTRGDQIFQQIMKLPEYYPTRCEEQILKNNKQDILETLFRTSRTFDLVELGAGDGKKTKILLSHFLQNKARFRYLPVDISAHALHGLSQSLRGEFPQLQVQTFAKDYFQALEDIGETGSVQKLVLFMGGNIGNFSKREAGNFMSMLAGKLKKGDLVLAGFDLKKDPAVIYHAYNDRQGVTRAFNFNLLERINRELDANFRTGNFIHYPTYDPLTGAMKSYLIAEKAHEVKIKKLDMTVTFNDWEPVYMEVSNKYDTNEIEKMAEGAGMRTEVLYFDDDRYYVNALLSKI
jgi:L-histidine N-alpha-methyltransferase